MKIELEVSEENESTSYPYWVIIDPHWLRLALERAEDNGDILKYDEIIRQIACSTSGLFFSRKAAEKYLKENHYNFTKHAKVYCLSGHNSIEYKLAFLDAKLLIDKKSILTFEQTIAEFRKNDQQRFKVKMENDVNLIGTLRYIMHYSSLDVLIHKEFEFYNEEKSTST